MTLPGGIDAALWLLELPCLMGGMCFVTGAYLSWAAAHKSLSLLAGDPRQTSFWTPSLYLVVSPQARHAFTSCFSFAAFAMHGNNWHPSLSEL